MTDTLHEIPDDDLRRRIVQAENLLDQLYGEKFRRTREAPKEDTNYAQRRRNNCLKGRSDQR